jgi:hypothetical protein
MVEEVQGQDQDHSYYLAQVGAQYSTLVGQYNSGWQLEAGRIAVAVAVVASEVLVEAEEVEVALDLDMAPL